MMHGTMKLKKKLSRIVHLVRLFARLYRDARTVNKTYKSHSMLTGVRTFRRRMHAVTNQMC